MSETQHPESLYAKHRARRGVTPPDLQLALREPTRLALRKPWLPADKGAAILDLGCGWGHHLLAIWAAGYRNLVGVDGDAYQCDIARRHLPREIVIHHEDASSFLDRHCGAFDLVVCIDVIEHFSVADAMALAGAVRKGLRPGGSAVFNTPNCATLLGSALLHGNITHRAGYTESGLLQLLDAAGFEGHRLVDCTLDTIWRFWRFKGGLQLRRRLNYALHHLVYRLAGSPPPACLDKSIEVQTFAPGGASEAVPGEQL